MMTKEEILSHKGDAFIEYYGDGTGKGTVQNEIFIFCFNYDRAWKAFADFFK